MPFPSGGRDGREGTHGGSYARRGLATVRACAPVRRAQRTCDGREIVDPASKVEKPVILVVDDEPAVLSAVALDLRREYGQHYRVVRAASGEAALEAVRELKLPHVPVSLFLVDQRIV